MQTLTCRTCAIPFTLTPAEEAGYAKFGFDPIPECFMCMQMHKLTFRNGRTLYRRTCDATRKQILSVYHPDSPYVVYERDYWYSDNWDAMEYGQEIDWNRPFFDQLKELQLKVPRMGLLNVNPDNSEYCNMCAGNKDCYCVFGGDYNQNVLYSNMGMHSRSCVDCDYGNNNELCHDIFESFDCYACRTIVDSKNCSNCAYVSDCTACHDCILCVNLKNKQYCIENEQLSKEEYEKRKTELLDGSYTAHMSNLKRLRETRSTRIVKFIHTISCENCTGDFLENAKDCENCFFASDCQDVTNAIYLVGAKDCFLCSYFGHKSELGYNCQSSIEVNRCSCCYFAIESSECEYCDTVLNSKNCFGCCNVRQKQYCILNKQYTKEQYEELRPKLIELMKKYGECGEFLRKDLGCFTYNESTAYDHYPISKEEALRKGFRWREQTGEKTEADRIIPADQLPDNIRDIPDDVLNWAIQSSQSGRPFKIIKQELEFYRTHNIPLPRLHPEERYMDRFSSYTNPLKLYDRECMNCRKDVRTTYSSDRTERVYCEECYLKEVY